MKTPKQLGMAGFFEAALSIADDIAGDFRARGRYRKIRCAVMVATLVGLPLIYPAFYVYYLCGGG